MRSKNLSRFWAACSMVLLASANIVLAQPQEAPGKKLRPPVVVRGFIGGESHDSYRVYVRQGKTLRVQLFWKHIANNRASFSVSRSKDYAQGDASFGQESQNGTVWVGKVPRSGYYSIFVNAYPDAKYALKVTTR